MHVVVGSCWWTPEDKFEDDQIDASPDWEIGTRQQRNKLMDKHYASNLHPSCKED
jgi:hypothetical protein